MDFSIYYKYNIVHYKYMPSNCIFRVEHVSYRTYPVPTKEFCDVNLSSVKGLSNLSRLGSGSRKNIGRVLHLHGTLLVMRKSYREIKCAEELLDCV